jgi:heptosyltransferase-2
MKIVIRAPNWIGDAVLAYPLLESLNKNLPHAQIWIAAKPWVKDLFTYFRFVDGIISLSAQNDIMSLRDSAREIRSHNFDAGLVLPNSFSAAFLFYLARIPQRWGYQRDGRGFLLTKGVSSLSKENVIHQVHYYLELLKRLGYQPYPPELKLPLTSQEKKEARNFLRSLNADQGKPLIILHPGASYGPSKRWPAQKYAQLAAFFQERDGATILIIGARNDSQVAESVSSLLNKKALNLAGKTSLRFLASLISQAALFVSNDSGPMHMANALRIPVVALFGPTDPRQTGPFHKPALVIKKGAPCWPCSYRECPYDHRCMMRIEAEEVYQISKQFL